MCMSVCVRVSRSPDTTIDGQPPALPPKQSRRTLCSQTSQSASQLELDNHINELYNVPGAANRTVVSRISAPPQHAD